MSAAPATRLSLRELAAKAYEAKREITQRDRRDRSRRLLWERMESDRFGLWGNFTRCDFDRVEFLSDDRACIDIEGIRLAAPCDASLAGLYLILDDGECLVEDIAHLGQALAELEPTP